MRKEKQGRDEKVKKDILAAITFFMTGLLFYVVQTDQKVNEQLSSGIDCEAAGQMVVGDFASQASVDITIQPEDTRDS